jgi:hypothetical protein
VLGYVKIGVMKGFDWGPLGDFHGHLIVLGNVHERGEKPNRDGVRG